MTTIYTVNNKVLKNSANDKWLTKKEAGPGPGPGPDPYNPLNLPVGTIRVRTSDGNPPRKGIYTKYETATLVTGTTNVYDVYKSGDSFGDIFYQSDNIVEVLGANTAGITNMYEAFFGCYSLTSVALFDTSSVMNMSLMFQSCGLTSVPLFDTSSVTNMDAMFMFCSSLTYAPVFNTSNVTNMHSMFQGCYSLTNVPLLDTSSVTDMNRMFCDCTNVQSGALALYQQASSQTNIPSHNNTFTDCGKDTVTGAAELAQIPSSWGGTGA